MRKSTNITMIGTPTFIRIYENPGRERDEYPIAVALDHHEPVALFTERAFALAFAMSLPDILELQYSVVEDSTSPDSGGEADQ